MRVAMVATIGAVGTLALVAVPSAASAADGDRTHDEVSAMEVGFACGPGDSTTATIGFHVDAYASTPDGGRIAMVQANLSDVPFENWHATLEPPEGYDFFATDDYSFGDVDLGRPIIEGDVVIVTLRYSDGATTTIPSATVDCFDPSAGTSVNDFEVTARLGVPKAVRLLEHVTYADLDADRVQKARVTTPGETWAAGWRGEGADDDLVLDAGTRASLGAALSDSVLTLTPATIGDYTLKWGVVTAPYDPDWAGGSGDERGPATITVHVIERPAPATEAMIVSSPHGPVVVPPSATAGGELTVSLGAGYAGQYVDLWLHSDPIYLGLVQVPADGTVHVALPASAPAGEHKLVVADEVGTLIGWGDVAVAAAPAATGTATPTATPTTNTVPRAATGLDEGAGTPWWLAAALVGLLVLGFASRAVAVRRAPLPKALTDER